MYRHLARELDLESRSFTLQGAEAHHLGSVLRLKEGAEVELFDGRGTSVATVVTKSGKRLLQLEAVGRPQSVPAPACRITLFPVVSKAKRMEWTLEKAVELGVSRIVPLLTERTVVQLRGADELAEKRERWQRLVAEAARQCGTLWLPGVTAPLTLAEALPELQACQPLLVAALSAEARPLREVVAALRPAASEHDTARKRPAVAGWVVGPEGDFTPDELTQLHEMGGLYVSLGRNILRTETAAIYGMAVLNAIWL